MANDDPVPDVPDKVGGKEQKLIIIGAAIVVAIILGVLVFLTIGKGGKKEGTNDETKAGVKENSGNSKGSSAGVANTIYPLEPVVVNIYDGEELRDLKVNIALEMANPGIKPDVDSHLAPIRDALIVLLCTKTIKEIMSVQGKNQLKADILATINNIISPGSLTKVYFTDFIVQ